MGPAFYYLFRKTNLNAIFTPLLSIKADTHALLRLFLSSQKKQHQDFIIYPGRTDLKAIFTLLLSIRKDIYALPRFFSFC